MFGYQSLRITETHGIRNMFCWHLYSQPQDWIFPR